MSAVIKGKVCALLLAAVFLAVAIFVIALCHHLDAQAFQKQLRAQLMQHQQQYETNDSTTKTSLT